MFHAFKRNQRTMGRSFREIGAFNSIVSGYRQISICYIVANPIPGLKVNTKGVIESCVYGSRISTAFLMIHKGVAMNKTHSFKRTLPCFCFYPPFSGKTKGTC
jgi:hypothetical protein